MLCKCWNKTDDLVSKLKVTRGILFFLRLCRSVHQLLIHSLNFLREEASLINWILIGIDFYVRKKLCYTFYNIKLSVLLSSILHKLSRLNISPNGRREGQNPFLSHYLTLKKKNTKSKRNILNAIQSILWSFIDFFYTFTYFILYDKFYKNKKTIKNA